MESGRKEEWRGGRKEEYGRERKGKGKSNEKGAGNNDKDNSGLKKKLRLTEYIEDFILNHPIFLYLDFSNVSIDLFGTKMAWITKKYAKYMLFDNL